MQVLFLTAVVEKSSRYRMDGDDVSSYLGMEYLEFLTHDEELDALRKKGYIRMDKDGNIVLPPEVLRTLKENRPVEPEKTSGLDTARILTRIRRKLSVRALSLLGASPRSVTRRVRRRTRATSTSFAAERVVSN